MQASKIVCIKLQLRLLYMHTRHLNPLLHNATKLTPLKYHVFENIVENGAFALGANAPFSIIIKVFKT